jgi:hypothetical protein
LPNIVIVRPGKLITVNFDDVEFACDEMAKCVVLVAFNPANNQISVASCPVECMPDLGYIMGTMGFVGEDPPLLWIVPGSEFGADRIKDLTGVLQGLSIQAKEILEPHERVAIASADSEKDPLQFNSYDADVVFPEELVVKDAVGVELSQERTKFMQSVADEMKHAHWVDEDIEKLSKNLADAMRKVSTGSSSSASGATDPSRSRRTAQTAKPPLPGTTSTPARPTTARPKLQETVVKSAKTKQLASSVNPAIAAALNDFLKQHHATTAPVTKDALESALARVRRATGAAMVLQPIYRVNTWQAMTVDLSKGRKLKFDLSPDETAFFAYNAAVKMAACFVIGKEAKPNNVAELLNSAISGLSVAGKQRSAQQNAHIQYQLIMSQKRSTAKFDNYLDNKKDWPSGLTLTVCKFETTSASGEVGICESFFLDIDEHGAIRLVNAAQASLDSQYRASVIDCHAATHLEVKSRAAAILADLRSIKDVRVLLEPPSNLMFECMLQRADCCVELMSGAVVFVSVCAGDSRLGLVIAPNAKWLNAYVLGKKKPVALTESHLAILTWLDKSPTQKLPTELFIYYDQNSRDCKAAAESYENAFASCFEKFHQNAGKAFGDRGNVSKSYEFNKMAAPKLEPFKAATYLHIDGSFARTSKSATEIQNVPLPYLYFKDKSVNDIRPEALRLNFKFTRAAALLENADAWKSNEEKAKAALDKNVSPRKKK